MPSSAYLRKTFTPADREAMANTFDVALSAPYTKHHYIDYATDNNSADTSSRASFVRDYSKAILLHPQFIQRSQIDPTSECHLRLIDSANRTHNDYFLKACENPVEDKDGVVISGPGIYGDAAANRSRWYLGTTDTVLDQNYLIELFEDKLADYAGEPKVLIAHPDFALQLMKTMPFQTQDYIGSDAALISHKLKLWDNTTLVKDRNVVAGEFYVVAKSAMKYAFASSMQFYADQLPAKGYVVQNMVIDSFGFRRNNESGVLKCFYKAGGIPNVVITGVLS